MVKKIVCLLLVSCLLLCGCHSKGEAKQSYTVTFLDYKGAVLDSQSVRAGKGAIAPQVPQEEGYEFIGWDRDFSCITSDLQVNALYAFSANPSLMVLEMLASAGETVTVPVVVQANPGIAGAKFTMVYDPSLTLTDAKSGTAFSALDYTGPGKFMSPCSFTWDSESGEVTENGTVLELTFTVPEDAVSGQSYAINCAYTEGDIYDENLGNVTLEVINGMITVK